MCAAMTLGMSVGDAVKELLSRRGVGRAVRATASTGVAVGIGLGALLVLRGVAPSLL
jgi:hypothetical protein